MKKNNDNRFSLIWGCGLLLLILCIFIGSNSSVAIKGTSAAATSEVCPEGYTKCANEFACDCVKQSNPSYTYAGKCYYVSTEQATPNGYCNCGVGELVTGQGICNLDGSCNCGTLNLVVDACDPVGNENIDMPCDSNNTCPTVSGYTVSKKECIQTNPTCPNGWELDSFTNKCVTYAEFEEPGRGCYSYATEDGKVVYIYGEYSTEDGYTYLGTDACPSSNYCDSGEYFDTETNECVDCPKGFYCSGDKKNACSGSNMTSPEGSDSASDCVCEDGTYMSTGGYCVQCPAGYTCTGGKKQICPENTYGVSQENTCKPCPDGKVSSPGSSLLGSCVVKTCSVGKYYSDAANANTGAKIKCGENNYTIDSHGNNCYTITCGEPCDCGDDGDCSDEFYACWQCGSSFNYGTDTVYASTCSQVDTSYCSSGGYSGCWHCSNGYKFGTNTQYGSSCTQVNSSYCSSGPNSKPSSSSSSSTPSSSSSSSTPSSSSSSQSPSSSSNVEHNPQTGSIVIFIVWILAFGAIAYSIYYFKMVREN